MSWTINNITFENFKVFKEQFSFSLEGKHFLLFGENGSGKSSLNWGLYTFLQSVLKLPDVSEAQKYFIPTHDQNLRNRFSNPSDYSGIKIEFKNDADGSTCILEDSISMVNTDSATGPRMRYSVGASDFLNYKYLSTVFDFKNSAQNDIFPMMYQEIFPIDDFATDIKDHNGVVKGKNMKVWWQTLQTNLQNLPRGTRGKRNHILHSGAKWDEFNEQLEKFNDQLKQFLQGVEMRANHMLTSDFETLAEINFDLHEAECIPRKPDSIAGDLQLKAPKIIVKARYTHSKAVNDDVAHPRSFFNEATLSKMALAIRLAITNNRVAPGFDVCKILVVDDLLISLDMANRCKVIDILLNYTSTFQVIILTHDRGFYQVVMNKINERKELAKWKLAQIYIKPSRNKDEIPSPVLDINKPGLDQALDFYLRGEFEAAVVTLRKECESNLKRLIPFVDIINPEKAYSKGEIKYLELSKMIQKLSPYFDRHFDSGLVAIMPNLTPNLHTFRELLLNQAAHNDYETPRFKKEIEDAFKEIEILAGITKTILVKSNQALIDEYKFSVVDSSGTEHGFEFKFAEVFSVLTYKRDNYYFNSNIVESIGDRMLHLADKVSSFCNSLRISVPSDILQHITHINSGKLLSDILVRLKG